MSGSIKAPTPPTAVRPDYYGGEENPFEVIKVFQAWFGPEEYRIWLKLTAVKYLARLGKKLDAPELLDLKKAHFYLGEYIKSLEQKETT